MLIEFYYNIKNGKWVNMLNYLELNENIKKLEIFNGSF